MKKKITSTMDRILADPKRAERFKEKYENFILSEALTESMKEQKITVRELARLSKVSATQIQGIRSGKKVNITRATMLSLFQAMGWTVSFLISNGSRNIIIS